MGTVTIWSRIVQNLVLSAKRDELIIACGLIGWENRRQIYYWTYLNGKECEFLGLPKFKRDHGRTVRLLIRVAVQSNISSFISMDVEAFPIEGSLASLVKLRGELLNLGYGNCSEIGGEGI